MRIFPSMRRIVKVGGGGGGGAGFVASVVKAGIQTTLQLRLIGSTVNTGVQFVADRFTGRVKEELKPAVHTSLLGATGDTVVEHSPGIDTDAGLRSMVGTETLAAVDTEMRFVDARGVPVNTGVDTDLLGATGSVVKPEAKPGISHTARISEFHEQEVPAFDIVQIKYDLNRRNGVVTATEYAVNARMDFDTPANAQGIHDGVLCSCPGNALGARSGGLRLEFTDPTGKNELAIVSVKLHFYTKRSAALVFDRTMRHQWRKGTSGAWTVLATYAGLESTNDFLTTPDTHDITASIASWADVASIEASVEADLALGGGDPVICDAVELEVTATATQTV